jgi:hypothetical protein
VNSSFSIHDGRFAVLNDINAADLLLFAGFCCLRRFGSLPWPTGRDLKSHYLRCASSVRAGCGITRTLRIFDSGWLPHSSLFPLPHCALPFLRLLVGRLMWNGFLSWHFHWFVYPRVIIGWFGTRVPSLPRFTRFVILYTTATGFALRL